MPTLLLMNNDSHDPTFMMKYKFLWHKSLTDPFSMHAIFQTGLYTLYTYTVANLKHTATQAYGQETQNNLLAKYKRIACML